MSLIHIFVLNLLVKKRIWFLLMHGMSGQKVITVSYTHLDVYKRQVIYNVVGGFVAMFSVISGAMTSAKMCIRDSIEIDRLVSIFQFLEPDAYRG